MNELTEKTFHEVIDNTQYAVVKFWADWCMPCKALTPRMENVAKLFGEDVTFASVNAEDNGELTTEFKVRNLPTILFFKNGTLADKTVGLITEAAIKDRIEQLLEV